MGSDDWLKRGWKEEIKVKNTILTAKLAVLNNYPLISIRQIRKKSKNQSKWLNYSAFSVFVWVLMQVRVDDWSSLHYKI
jgi:hypothetical protein